MRFQPDEFRRLSADSLFAAWLARHEAGEESEFEALRRDHPQAAAALRDLHAFWTRLEAARRQHGLSGTLSEKLKSQFGSGVDPQVTLEGEEQVRGEFSSEVLSRLAGRGSASTRYRIKGEVAHGGMGAVLRVWDEDLRRHLAMKVMLGKGVAAEKGDIPQADPKMLARFLEEAQVTGQLDHPGIVPVHELGLNAEGRVYFTMKLVKGKTLKDVFDELSRGEGGWSQIRVLGLIQKVCEAMSYAHAKGVIHRDLKPANVMVGKFGEVFVMDWGLAKILGREDEKDIRIRQEPDLTSEVQSERRDRASQAADSPLYTMDGDVVGTPAYMSPEQARGDLAAMGPPSDVYAVGAMLYYLLAGHLPYVPPGARVNNYAVWHRVQEGPPTPIHVLAPDQPAELVAICERAMAREVARRYSEMSALSEDLSAFVEGRVVHAYETGAWAETRKWVQRNKPLAASLAAAVVLLAAGLVVSLTQKARADAKTIEAQTNLTLAQRNETEAKDQQKRAEAETAKVLRLSDVKVLQELVAEVDELWPAHPEKIPNLQSWLDQARALASNLPDHRATLAEMQARAHPWSDEERAHDRETHPRAGELAENQAELDRLIAELDQGLEGEAQEQADKRVAELEPETAALRAEVESRRTWRFETREDQWQHDVLAELIGGLQRLESGLLAEDAITADHGWSVAKRLSFAQELKAGFGEGGEYAQAWNRALPGIRETYPGLDLKPQMGLLPISPDPASGLWEFAHLMTGVSPERGADGKLILTEETGVVLVLLRGGTFWMGAQKDDPAGHNYDPQAEGDEGPVHEVDLTAFFLSKCELAQGQWVRLTGRNPSQYGPHKWNIDWLSSRKPASLLHPVEQVSWLDCMVWLPRMGLAIPSEAQWEYGARGGTETPWWTGREKESLAGAANLEDKWAQAHGMLLARQELWLDDGATGQAPVGSYAANAFGLSEVAGNLWEWCLDAYEIYGHSPRRDPVSPWAGATSRVYRGGCFLSQGDGAHDARSAYRANNAPSYQGNNVGVRPARAIDP
jgi:serine/threonine protein kinase/formylglycine-generating enzyme required for sulfatase activity